MAFPEGTWQVLAAVIAAAAALWQFAGLKENRRAGEFEQLERSIRSAAERKDPAEHAYRSYMFRRMQAVHGNRSSAGFMAAMWGLLTLLFLLLAGTAKDTTAVGQLVAFAGLLGSMTLAARNLGQFMYGSRTLDAEMGQALELSMVAAREAFVVSSKDLPPLKPAPNLAEHTRRAWRRTAKAKRRDAAGLVVITALSVAFALLGPHAIRQDWFEWKSAVLVTVWFLVACVASAPLFSRTMKSKTATLRPRWAGPLVYWGGQIAWASALLLFGPPWLNDRLIDLIRQDVHATFEDLFAMLGACVGIGLFTLWIAWYPRLVRWWTSRAQALAPS